MQLQSRLRTRYDDGGSSTLLVCASGSPPTQPQPPPTASAPTPRPAQIDPRRHPYLRLGSSRPCPFSLPAMKRSRRRNYEFRQRPRDPVAVFPGADGSRSSGARSNRKRLGLPASSARGWRFGGSSAAPAVTEWGQELGQAVARLGAGPLTPSLSTPGGVVHPSC